MAKRGGKEENAEDVGCMCWDCARLGGCRWAICGVETCGKFVKSEMRRRDVAKILRVSWWTLQRRSNAWIIEEMAKKGYTLVQGSATSPRFYLKIDD